MSYILEALKKSESERRAATLPGLAREASFMVAPRSHPAPGPLVLGASAAMLLAGLALGSWRPWQALPVIAVPPAVPAVAALPALRVAAAPAVPARSPVAPSAAAPGPSVPSTSSAPARGTLAVPAAPPASSAMPVAADPVTAAPTMVPPRPRPAVAEPAAKPEPRSPEASPARPAARAPAPRPAEAPVRPPPPAAAEPSGQVVAYRELPAEVQGAVPAVTFGGYAGVDEGGTPVAFINARLVKQGEELSPGVRLERVGQDGVVLGYRGHRFRP